MNRYAVPYSAPGIRWGELRVRASNPAEAVERAREIHGRTTTLYRYDLRRRRANATRLTLRKREREQIAYGEPRLLPEVASNLRALALAR